MKEWNEYDITEGFICFPRETVYRERRLQMKKKFLIVFGLLFCLILVTFVGCGQKEETARIYYLNFKPESTDSWKEIAKAYEAETGIEVRILTAASGSYEQTLKSEIAKKKAPTLFQINGPVDYEKWKNYCRDLSDTQFYSWLLEPDMAVKNGDGVYGIPYVVEGYGIIYNDGIMKKYFSLPSRKTDFGSMDEVNNFDKLKSLVEDMSQHLEELGIEGVFASTSFSEGEDWRWQTHLANLPVYYEFSEKGIADEAELDFSYEQNYKNIFDLYINHSCTAREDLGSKTVDDSMKEFALGKAAMVQNGNWAWNQISGIDGNQVKEQDVKFLPIYTGVNGEEKQGLCIGTESYICVNSIASEADQQASIAFLEWLYGSETGKKYVTDSLGFISPFNTFSYEESPNDPLARQVVAYMSDTDKKTVNWDFTAFPSQRFKNEFGNSLYEYCTGKTTWEDVVESVKKNWASEKALTLEEGKENK